MRKTMDLRLNKGEVLNCCVEILAVPGAVLLIPTDTVYGLVCRWNDFAAIAAIREMKGRGEEKPFQMLAPNTEGIAAAGIEVSPSIKRLMDAFCPGPLTIIAKKSSPSDDDVLKTVGFRIPDHPFLLNLMRGINANLAATSANIAGRPPILTLSEAEGLFSLAPALSIDGGAIEGAASTVINATTDAISIIRNGPITAEMIAEKLQY